MLVCSNCDNLIKSKKSNVYTLCYKCYFILKYGIDKWAANVSRLKQRNIRRHIRNGYRKSFYCEMGYSDCEQRGFCNGDC